MDDVYALAGVALSGATRSNYHDGQLYVVIGGFENTDKVIVESVQIADSVNEEPTTASMTVLGLLAQVGTEVIMALGSEHNAEREFGGQVISRTVAPLTDDEDNTATAGRALALIDFTWGMNKRLVSGYYTGSATTIAESLVSTYASGYTSDIEQGLPTVEGGITFTNQTLTDCLTQLFKRIGGTWFCDFHKVVRGFVTDNTADTPPSEINASHPTFRQFSWTRDLSQVVTRVHVEGGGGQAASDVAAGETILPVTNAEWYPAVGVVTSGPQRITHTSVDVGGGGGLVGPGVGPTGVLVAALASGAGVESGAHQYTSTFVTASGESIAGPVTTITIGSVDAPTSAPTAAAAPTIGTGPDPGSHDYAVTFVTSSGETTASPSATKSTTITPAPAVSPTAGTPTTSGSVTPGDHDYLVTFVTSIGETAVGPASGTVTTTADIAVSDPSTAPTNAALDGSYTAGWLVGDSITYRVTFLSSAGETAVGPLSNAIIGSAWSGGGVYLKACEVTDIPVPASPYVVSKRLYRYVNGVVQGYRALANAVTSYVDYSNITAGSPPGANTATITGSRTVPLTSLPLGDANVTSRRIYRRFNGSGTYKRVTTIANNTATTYSDTTANGSLGVDAPTSNAAYLQRIALADIPTGGPLVTSRRIYRTAAGGSQLKLAHTLADNTTAAWTDTVTDASLGANVPVTNTATANQVALSGIPIGASSVTSRRIYRTVAGGSQLKLQSTIANNTATTLVDSTPDGSLGANVPVSDTSGLTQPAGQVLPGATSMPITDTGAFPSSGWAVIGNGEQVIRYTGLTASTLTGIPASGSGAIVAAVSYNSTVTASPQLRGIPASGDGSILYSVLKGDDVNLWVTVNDTAAQTALAVLIGGDGIQEFFVQDRRLARTEATARGEAVLALRKDPEIIVRYTSRDINTGAGRLVPVNLQSIHGIQGEFLIQSVTQTFQLTQPATRPLYQVEASSMRLTFEQLLQIKRAN